MLQLFTHLQNALFPFIVTSLQQLKAENTCETLAAISTEQSCHRKRQVFMLHALRTDKGNLLSTLSHD